MKKRLWQLHSWLGLLAGLGLLVVGLSGSVLVFREEIDAVLDPALRVSTPRFDASRPGADALLARVRAQVPGEEVVAWNALVPEGAPNGIALAKPGSKDWRWIKVDPSTGMILQGRHEKRTFTDWLLDVHVSLLSGDWGTVLVGAFASLLCFLGLSGVWLYRDFWRNFFRLRWRASARIFFSDLHKAVGISSVAFNLVLGFTGAYWNLPTLKTLLGPAQVRAAAEPPPVRLYNSTLSVDDLIIRARQAMPDLRGERFFVEFPPRMEDISVSGPVATRNPFRSEFGGRVTFDRETGALKKVTDIRQQGWWTQAEDMMGPLHFGTFGGLPIKILWSLGGLTPSVLAISGFLIWRVRSRPRRRAQPVLTRHPAEMLDTEPA